MKTITIDLLLSTHDTTVGPGCTTRDVRANMTRQGSAGFRATAVCLLGAFALFVTPMESQAKHKISGARSYPPQTRSYIPSQCGTRTLCIPERIPGKLLNGSQTCVNYDKRDIKTIVANWKDDFLEGYFWCANDDGIPQVEANYLHGELEGTYKEYSQSLKDWGFEQTYKNGKREGFSRKKRRDGHFTVAFYRDDKRHGYELVVDAQNRIKQTTDCTVFGQRAPHKECESIAIPGFEKSLRTYIAEAAKAREAENNRVVEAKYGNGQVRHRYQLVNGVIDGKYEVFFSNGNPSAISLYDKGQKYEETRYFEEGQIKQVTRFLKDLVTDQLIYYQNGKKKSEGKMAGRDGLTVRYEYKEYFDNGYLAEEGARYGSLSNGVFDGEVKSYRKTGELATLSIYDKGMRAGTWKYSDDKYDIEDIYKQGKLQTRMIFDKKTKLELKRSEFMPDGSLKSEKISPAEERSRLTESL